jgi:hypothetical protein
VLQSSEDEHVPSPQSTQRPQSALHVAHVSVV